ITSWEYGYWWLEWGGELDTIKDNRRIRHELLRIVLGVWDYIKNSGDFPESANWALEWVGMIPGKRESRRIIGDHILIQQELERAEPFPDRVAYGGWPMDDHPPGGIDRRDLEPCRQVIFDRPYHIPLRSLYSKNRTNLLMAGRNISASHVAFSSTRVMATCSVMGQAVGAAAAFCIQKKLTPRELASNTSRMREFQQLLLKQDQALIGIRNEDPDDLARQARVTASAETPDGAAVSIIDGWNRNIEDGQSHQWRAPLAKGPQWIQLEWSSPQRIREVLITFDSGLNRKLFLTGVDREYFQQIRGPQPETVADYTIEAKMGGAWHRVASVKDNFLRLRKHNFQDLRTTNIRITVHRTNGDGLARIFQVRCYA
ncbi:MAG: FAD-dependent oxidoreductase, partial [Calditrichaeota bacterium]|nr:FAD-dependent oxidoreductase [Calditrichota bacterium]